MVCSRASPEWGHTPTADTLFVVLDGEGRLVNATGRRSLTSNHIALHPRKIKSEEGWVGAAAHQLCTGRLSLCNCAKFHSLLPIPRRQLESRLLVH